MIDDRANEPLRRLGVVAGDDRVRDRRRNLRSREQDLEPSAVADLESTKMWPPA